MGRNWTSPMKWDNQGSEPSESLKTSGFSGGYKPPAAVFNYMFNKVKTWITELQGAVDDIDGSVTSISETKVDKESGKSLSTNDYTTDEKNKLAGIAAGATKTIVDSALNSTSENPVQNKIVTEELKNKKSLDIPQTSTVTVSSDNKVYLDSYTSPTEIFFVTSDVDNGLHDYLLNSPNSLTNSCLFRVETVNSEVMDGAMILLQTIIDGIYGRTFVRSCYYIDDGDTTEGYFSDWSVKVEQTIDTYTKKSFILNRSASSVASGNYAIVGGVGNVAYDRQTVIGKYADTSSATDKGGVASDAATTGSLLTVGNGTGNSARTNVFRISASGQCYGAKAWGGSGAGLAEYWEWSDGNPNNEDRRGHFVTLDGDKIRIATPQDSYILGVIDPCPFVVGDVQSESWKNMYLKDIFGETMKETVTVPESVDENTGETIPEHTETRFIINPEYDNTNDYISREDRPEWDSITQHGKVVMIDDGTCEVNKYCTVGNGGIATASEDNYKVRVLKRIDDTHIQVFIDGVFVKQ